MLGSGAHRRAERLVRWYPRAWRERYGDEFIELLIDDISERPRCVGRMVDVIGSGLQARLAARGLTGRLLDPIAQARTGLAVAGGAWAVFVVVGIAIWSQLTVGWQWSAPATGATRTAMFVMSGAMAGFVVLGSLAAAPLAWGVVRALRSGVDRPLACRAALAVITGALFAVGCVHFGHGWPGTGGHPWSGRGLVPAPVARFGWAATLWVTSYWVHPAALLSFPAVELAWMVVSPIALIAALTSTAGAIRRLAIASRVLRYETRLGTCTSVVMGVFLAGAGSWVISVGPGPRGLFQVGAIDTAGLAVLTAALVVAFRAIQHALTADTSRRAGF